MMKIMFISSDNAQGSGAFRSMVALANILKKKYSAEIEVIVPAEGDGSELLKKNDIKYKTIKSYSWITSINDSEKLKNKISWELKKAVNRLAVKKIKEEILDFQPDIVHVNTTWSYVGAVAAYELQIPVVWHLREFLEEDQHVQIWNKKNGYELLSKASCVIAISSAIKEKYDKLLTKKTTLVYNGIDEKKYFHKRKILLPTSKNVTLLTVGSLYPGKGHSIVIDALAKLQKMGYTCFKYNIVGEGAERKNIEEKILNEGIESEVKLWGFSKNTEKFYQNNDVFIMGSVSEAFGRVTVEAMMNGMLVIGRNTGGTSEILDDGKYGLLFQTSDELANKLEHIIKNKQEYQIIAKRGQEHAIEKYTADYNADNIEKIYEGILLQKNT